METNTPQIDWRHGSWESPTAGRPAAEILIAGDWAPIRDFSDIILANPKSIYGDLLPILQSCHLRIVNLECPLADVGAPAPKSGAVFKGLSAHIGGLTTVPFEVATLGNNHVFDYGVDAFVQTQNLLRQHGIQSTGAGMSLAEAEKPLVVSANGVSIGIISFSEGEDLTAAAHDRPGVLGWDIQRIIRRIREIRSRAHIIIVVCHGGVEYIPFPPPYLVQALQQIAEAGADLIIGHHPHVPQGIQIHNHVPICYSLGNFVFFQPTNLLYRKIGYMVKAGVSMNGVNSLRVIPYEIRSDRLMLLKDEKLLSMSKKLAALSKPLARPNDVAGAWHGFLKHYGAAGFKNEISGILNRLETDTPKAAAMFRNRLTTLQHYHLLTDLMTRLMDGTLADAPEWAVEFAAAYFTRKVGEGLPQ